MSDPFGGLPSFNQEQKAKKLEEEQEEQKRAIEQQQFGDVPLKDTVGLVGLQQLDTIQGPAFGDVPLTDIDSIERNRRLDARRGLEEFVQTGDPSNLPARLAMQLGQAQATFAPDITGHAINRPAEVERRLPAALPLVMLGFIPGAIPGLLLASPELRQLLDPDIPLPDLPPFEPEDLERVINDNVLLPSAYREKPFEMGGQGYLDNPEGGPLRATARAAVNLTRRMFHDPYGTVGGMISAPFQMAYFGMKEQLLNVPLARGPIIHGLPTAENPNGIFRAPGETNEVVFRLEELRQRWADSVGRMTPYQAEEARRGMIALLAAGSVGAMVKAGLGPGQALRNLRSRSLLRRATGRSAGAELADVELSARLGTFETAAAPGLRGVRLSQQAAQFETIQQVLNFSEVLGTSEPTLRIFQQIAGLTDAAATAGTFGFFLAQPGERFERAVTFAVGGLSMYGMYSILNWGVSTRAFSPTANPKSPRNPGRANDLVKLQSARPFDNTSGPIPFIDGDTGAIPMGRSVVPFRRPPPAELQPRGGEESIVTPPPVPTTAPLTGAIPFQSAERETILPTLDDAASPDHVPRRNAEETASALEARIAREDVVGPDPVPSSVTERIRVSTDVRRGLFEAQEQRGGPAREVVITNRLIADINSQMKTFVRLAEDQMDLDVGTVDVLESPAFARRLAEATSAEAISTAVRIVAPELPDLTVRLMGEDLHRLKQELNRIVTPTGRRTDLERRDVVENTRIRERAGRELDVEATIRSLGSIVPEATAEFLRSSDFLDRFESVNSLESAAALMNDVVGTSPELMAMPPASQTLFKRTIIDQMFSRARERLLRDLDIVGEGAEIRGRPATNFSDEGTSVVGDRSGFDRRIPEVAGRRGRDFVDNRDPDAEPLVDARAPSELNDVEKMALLALRKAHGDVQAARTILQDGLLFGLIHPEQGNLFQLTTAALEEVTNSTRGMEHVDVWLDSEGNRYSVTEQRRERPQTSPGDVITQEVRRLDPDMMDAIAARQEIDPGAVANAERRRILGEAGAGEYDALKIIEASGRVEQVAEARERLTIILARLDPGARNIIEGLTSVDRFGLDVLPPNVIRTLAEGKRNYNSQALSDTPEIELIDILATEMLADFTTGVKGAESTIKMEGAIDALVKRGRNVDNILNSIADRLVELNPGTILNDQLDLVKRRALELRRDFQRLDELPYHINTDALVPSEIAENTAIWLRNHGDPVATLVDQLRTKPNQTVIIRGETTPARTLELAGERLGSDVVMAVHPRPGGLLFDIGLGGMGSPFQLPSLRDQFIKEGHFSGQKISVGAVNYEYLRRGDPALGENPSDVMVRLGPNENAIPISHTLMRSVKDVETINEFAKVAAAQRNLPERAALRIKEAQISQIYSWVAQNVGDLTRIMSEAITFRKGNFTEVESIVNRMIFQLANSGPIMELINRQVAHNAVVKAHPGVTDELMNALVTARKLENITGDPSASLSLAEQRDLSRLKQLGRDYALHHNSIPTINRVQRLAQDAAIAIGEMRFDVAVERLEILKRELNKGERNWEKVTASSTTPTIRQVLESIFDPSEMVAYDNLRKRLQPPSTQQLLEDGTRYAFETLRSSASTNGYILDRTPAATYVLRGQATGDDVFASPNLRDIETFITNSGQREGLNLDAVHGIDPSVPGSVTPPPPAGTRPNEPFPVPAKRFIESLQEIATAMLPWLSPFKDWAAATDARNGTKIFSEVWLKTNPTAFAAAAWNVPWLEELLAINKAYIKAGGSLEKLESFHDNMQTMSEAELRASHLQGGSPFKSRSLNPVELGLVDELIRLDVDPGRILQYIDSLFSSWGMEAERLGVEIGDLPIEVAQAADLAIQASENITPAEVQAAGIYKEIRKADVGDISIYGITRTVLAHRTGALTREEHAAQEGYTAQDIETMRKMEDIYARIAADPSVPITDQQLINGYVAYVSWRQKASSENAFLQQPGANRELQFVHNMIRQGEGSPYDNNPIKNLAAYIRAVGREVTGFNKAWNESNQYVQSLPKSLGKLVAESYLGAVRGNLPWETKNAQDLLDNWFKEMGWKVAPNIRNDLINTGLALNSGALIGMRTGLTLRDFTWFGTAHYSRFGGSPAKGQGVIRKAFESMGIGASRTIRALQLSTKRWSESGKQMREEGIVPSIGPIQFETPSQLLSSNLGHRIAQLPAAMRKIAELGFVFGGQKHLYEALFTGTLLEAREFNGKAATLFQQGEITKEQFYDIIKLDTFSKAMRLEFDEMITAEKWEQAVEVLSRMTATDILALYGMANHPWGWGTNPGRLAGQYGNWPVNATQYMLGGFTRGTSKVPFIGQVASSRQIGFATRFAMGSAAMAATGKFYGLDFGAWFVLPGLFFVGGPLVQTAEDLITVFASNAPDVVKERTRGGMQRMWPQVDLNDHRNTDVRTMWFPGTYFINDIMEARRLSQEGKPLVQAVGRFFNIPRSDKPSVYFDGAEWFRK